MKEVEKGASLRVGLSSSMEPSGLHPAGFDPLRETAPVTPSNGKLMKDFRCKRVMRLDPQARKFRLLRIMWEGPKVTRGGWLVSNKLTFALRPKLVAFAREFDSWRLTLLFVEVHFKQSHGGRFA